MDNQRFDELITYYLDGDIFDDEKDELLDELLKFYNNMLVITKNKKKEKIKTE